MTTPTPNARSRTIAVASLAASSSNFLYQVPAGFVLLLKSICCQNGGNANNSLTLSGLQESGGNANFLQIDLTAFQVKHELPWIVLEPGDQLFGHTGPHPVAVWISGALILE